MGRSNIKVLIRSETTILVRPGVSEYSYDVFKNIQATVNSSGYSVTDNQTVNQEVTPSNTKLSFILANDNTNRINRITMVEYFGTLYRVISIENARPRVIVTLGEIANIKLLDLNVVEVSNG